MPSLSLLVLNRIEAGNRWYIGMGNREKFDERAIYRVVGRVKGNQQGIEARPDGGKGRKQLLEPGGSYR